MALSLGLRVDAEAVPADLVAAITAGKVDMNDPASTVVYWNAYVANTQMYGKGTFLDSRRDNAKQYPAAAKAGWGRKRHATDLITAKLPALHFYELAMRVPKAPAGSFDAEAAKRAQAVVQVATCLSR